MTFREVDSKNVVSMLMKKINKSTPNLEEYYDSELNQLEEIVKRLKEHEDMAINEGLDGVFSYDMVRKLLTEYIKSIDSLLHNLEGFYSKMDATNKLSLVSIFGEEHPTQSFLAYLEGSNRENSKILKEIADLREKTQKMTSSISKSLSKGHRSGATDIRLPKGTLSDKEIAVGIESITQKFN